MMEYEILDIENWKRKEHYHFFRTFEEPFTGVVAEVDVTKAKSHCKSEGLSFFQYYLHRSIKAVNLTSAFRLRIVNEEVRRYESIHASATISRLDGTFGFSYIEYDDDILVFGSNLNREKERIAKDRSLFPPFHSECVVHYSSMPWIKFTSVSHARKLSAIDSSPKISFGKVFSRDNEDFMPVSVHVHHALVDGKDIAEHLDHFQRLLDLSEE